VKYDLVFSNAAIQWIPNHEDLLGRMASLLVDRGALAVQIPLFREMPMGISIDEVSRRAQWNSRTGHCRDLFSYNSYGFYYETLSALFSRIEMWETSYLHEMDSQEALIDWVSSTGMRPFLDAIEKGSEKEAFAVEVLEMVKDDYPLQRNGKVLFPFKRLFFVAYGG